MGVDVLDEANLTLPTSLTAPDSGSTVILWSTPSFDTASTVPSSAPATRFARTGAPRLAADTTLPVAGSTAETVPASSPMTIHEPANAAPLQ